MRKREAKGFTFTEVLSCFLITFWVWSGLGAPLCLLQDKYRRGQTVKTLPNIGWLVVSARIWKNYLPRSQTSCCCFPTRSRGTTSHHPSPSPRKRFRRSSPPAPLRLWRGSFHRWPLSHPRRLRLVEAFLHTSGWAQTKQKLETFNKTVFLSLSPNWRREATIRNSSCFKTPVPFLILAPWRVHKSTLQMSRSEQLWPKLSPPEQLNFAVLLRGSEDFLPLTEATQASGEPSRERATRPISSPNIHVWVRRRKNKAKAENRGKAPTFFTSETLLQIKKK